MQQSDFFIKTPCFYLIKFDHIFGTLIVKNDSIVFEPCKDVDQNQHLVAGEVKISDYGSTIDFLDIAEVNKLPLINEKAVISENAFIAEAYKFDWFLQIVLTTVNGVTLRQNFETSKEITGALIDDTNDGAIIQRNTVPVANIYFRFNHKDHADPSNSFHETALTNKYQELVVDEIHKRIEKQRKIFVEKNKQIEITSTFVPYYDSIIQKKMRTQLSRVKLNPVTLSKVNNQHLISSMQKTKPDLYVLDHHHGI